MKKTEQCKDGRLPSYGGQALIEGVMMRGVYSVSAAMRAPDGKIVIHTEPLSGIYSKKWGRVPFVRGLMSLWDSLGLGMRYLTMSANLQSGEQEKIEGKDLAFTVATSLLIVMVLFFAAPAFLASLIERYAGISSFFSNVIEGVIRLVAIVGYIWGIGKMPEINRVFAYHGAEHKTINAFEDHASMSPELIKRYSLEHPRCGTAFLLTLVILSIIIFAAIGPLSFFWRIATRIILLPLLAGIAYEFIRYTARNLSNPLVKLIIRPNLALQKLTTREPDEAMIEVAVAAFNSMMEAERQLSPAVKSNSVGDPCSDGVPLTSEVSK